MGFLSRLFSKENSAVFLVDSKNTTGDLVSAFQRDDIDAHVYAAGKSGEFTLDPQFKGGDYSARHREQELQMISTYHRKHGVKAIILPISIYLDESDAMEVIDKVKAHKGLRDIPIIQMGGDEKLTGVTMHTQEQGSQNLIDCLNHIDRAQNTAQRLS